VISKGTKKHTKHAALVKPLGGEYHRNEWGIIGAPCSVIHELASDINAKLKNILKLGYLDADHNKGRRSDKYHSSLTDKINYLNFKTNDTLEQKQCRRYFNALDLLIVNGNHFKADKQIVIIDERKKESLSRKVDRLSNIKMIIINSDKDEIYDFVLSEINNEKEVSIFRIDQIDKICQSIMADLNKSIPPVFGLVLAGGKSQRMGEDKGALQYYDKPHREHTADLISKFCFQTFISCRKNQDELIETDHKKLYDTFDGLGPYGGILSAFREQPNMAWLTVACDLPYLAKETVQYLYEHRNPTKLATCFHNPETDFPEPLITIWEPRAYPVLLEFLSQGYSCPRKVLINTNIEILEMTDPEEMHNANDKLAFESAKHKINNH
jgi:molybdopterin-guanine dinucleotide biosynthesis protein A